jgi:hypothetical protein
MKLIDYKLEKEMQYLQKDKPMQFFKEHISSILEDQSKPYHQRADYIGLSLNGLKSKIDDVSKSIKELQEHKKRLTSSLDLAKSIIADAFISNGIDRIDGNLISSLTISKATTKTKTNLIILNKEKVMELGFVKYIPDEEAIKKVLDNEEQMEKLKEFISIDIETSSIPEKIKVNNKRSKDEPITGEILQIVHREDSDV